MTWWMLVTWCIGLTAFAALIGGLLRPLPAALRSVLVIVSSASLTLILSGQWASVILFFVGTVLVVATWRLSQTRAARLWIVVLVALLVASKLPGAARLGSADPGPGMPLPIWLGFSYLAFRLIHVTIEAHTGRLGDITLPELLVYALHPASLVAGPIDRARRSAACQREPLPAGEALNQGIWRLLLGLSIKFVIANPLFSVVAAQDMVQNPDRPVGIAWVWLLAYSFFLLADFAAYTHIAIGFGYLSGLRLPENFARPYLAPSITLFWQRWHITLSSWLRDYIFFPLARFLRARTGDRYRGGIQLICHLATMIAAGLWHGLSGGFLLWGVWHGLGLFAHSQFALRAAPARSRQAFWSGVSTGAGTVLTFTFVSIGWVFFAADVPTALRILARLFGVR